MELDILKLSITILCISIINFVSVVIYGRVFDKSYLALKKSPIELPANVIPFAKSTVAFIISISFYLIWATETSEIKTTMMLLYVGIIFLGIMGSYFQLIIRRFDLAILTAIASIILGDILFRKVLDISLLAAYFLIPYSIWVIYLLISITWTAVINIKGKI